MKKYLLGILIMIFIMTLAISVFADNIVEKVNKDNFRIIPITTVQDKDGKNVEIRDYRNAMKIDDDDAIRSIARWTAQRDAIIATDADAYRQDAIDRLQDSIDLYQSGLDLL